uniref:Hsp20/alpha crystallin family protein n=1 Tax=Ndongobacter massiliensis TaxID=1871025 RepID=UPI000930AA77|nr:Hsp20/alpha crystallin family protein [Ndongobacter massiliensis]
MRKLVAYNRPLQRYNTVNDFIDDFFNTSLTNGFLDTTFKVDVENQEKSYVVTADLPGIDKKEVQIDVEDGTLTIAVEKSEESSDSDEKKNYLHRERRFSSCSRTIRLADIDESNISASLENGVLRVEIPKAEEVINKKTIQIQ